jgi:dienelactone hydrolase
MFPSLLISGAAIRAIVLVTVSSPLPAAHVFAPFLDGKAPEIVREVQPWTLDEKLPVLIRKVVIKARTIPESADGDSDVLVILAKPAEGGKRPGLLHLHGGGGAASEGDARRWASAGYVVAAPDLPGIANPANVPHSSGPIRRPYDKSRWTAEPDASASTLFDGVAAGIKAFYMLKAQPEVIPDKVGITGVSWGGYTTTMLCGLLGAEVKAAVSVWGAGFYDYGSTFLRNPGWVKMPPVERDRWLQHLDAGRYAANIQCAMLFVAATNDKWFYPPCVMQTYNTVSSPKTIVWAPNKSHYADNIPGGSKSPKRRSIAGMESDFLDYHLLDAGKSFPAVGITLVQKSAAGIEITGALQRGEAVESLKLWHSAPPTDGDWPRVEWQEQPCTRRGDDGFSATIPVQALHPSTVFFITASEHDRSVSTPLWAYPGGRSPWSPHRAIE